MTKEEFKKRWDSDERGGGITKEFSYPCILDSEYLVLDGYKGE